MAQEIMVAGAIYEDVPSVRLPDSQGNFHPFTDTSDTTAVADDVAEGKIFHLADGTAAIGTASGGGGGGDVNPIAPENDVIFVDYDGTIRYSYTAEEFLALTEMPPNPTHEGLVAQGWGQAYSLSIAKSLVREQFGSFTIGQSYTTESGDTEIDIDLPSGATSPFLSCYASANNLVTIYWGDGASSEVAGQGVDTPLLVPHEYASAGKYTIRLRGSFYFGDRYLSTSTGNWPGILNAGVLAKENYKNYTYQFCIKAIRLARGACLRNFAFYNLKNLEYITFPTNLVNSSMGKSALENCISLKAVCTVLNISADSSRVFASCQAMKYLSIPRGPGNTTSMLSVCGSLRRLELYCETIGNSACYSCSSLTKISISTQAKTIGTYAFANCGGLKEMHFKSGTPPEVSSSTAFSALPTDCIIYVPAGSLEAYESASNYPSPSTYTYVEE